nr:hypothetical protein [Tanacetum cinerariifolium]
TDVKFRSADGGFVALVIGGGVRVDCCGGGVKDGNDCRMTVEYIGETETVESLVEAGFLNFHAFLGGVTHVA